MTRPPDPETDREAHVIRHRAIVTGRVQGVGFRYHTVDRARALGLTGWVRNRPDGTVELEVQGRPDSVAPLVSWLHEGPGFALVERVETETLSPRDDERAFRVVP